MRREINTFSYKFIFLENSRIFDRNNTQKNHNPNYSFSVSKGIKRSYSEFIDSDEYNVPIALRSLEHQVDVEEFNIGNMNVECPYCGALFFKKKHTQQSFNKCCNNGKINLKKLEDPPDYLKKLYEYNDEKSKEFFQNIRKLNSAFSFVSIGERGQGFKRGLDKDLASMKKGNYVYKIHGGIYHRIGSLKPSDGKEHCFSQIYFYDTEYAAVKRRNEIFENTISEDLLLKIQRCLEENNHLIKEFKQIGTEILNQPDSTMVIKDNYLNVDIRVYNEPKENQIIGIVPNSASGLSNPREIVIKNQSDEFQIVSQYHSAIDALSYVLLFPYGEMRYNHRLFYLNEKGNITHITLLMFMNHYLQVRKNNFNVLFKSGKLGLQYVTNKWLDVEDNNLAFIRNNQKKVRAELYTKVIDAFNENKNLNDIGRSVILPPSFHGGPRHMWELYHDAMSIVLNYGKPDLFITFTTNPNWPEIKNQLFKNQQVWERPDIVCKVFNAKVKELMHDLIKIKIFGAVKAYIYVIEFQKRGLPHAHILVILDKKIVSVNEIDRCISAEVPDKTLYLDLYEKVTKFMIHGACNLEKSQQCVREGKCTKKFPKSYIDSTKIIEGTYPLYRRRNRFKTKWRNYDVGDEFVVPYNAYLLTKFNAHINVEICSSFTAIKYLYKYVYKGPDRAIVSVKNPFDEIERYIDSRAVTAIEATWRLNSFKIHNESPTVYKLPVHLRDCHYVYFDSEESKEKVTNQKRTTMLTAWFEANEKYPEYRYLLYKDYPKYFTFNDITKEWQKRKYHVDIVSRLQKVDVKDRERYYLKILLNHIAGATSFDDLKKFDGLEFSTHFDAVKYLGLIENDDQWHQTIQEAVLISSAKYCRELFAYIIVFCPISEPNKVWNKYKEEFCDDLHKDFPSLNNDQIYKMALSEIESILNENNRSLLEFDFEKSQIESNENYFELSAFDIETFELNMNSLTLEQKKIYDLILNSIDDKENFENKIFFIDSPGGTGKTFLLNTIIKKVLINKKIPISVASSGIAALLLINGKTAHSTFGIPIEVTENSSSSIHLDTSKAHYIKDCDLIIWDEVSMTNKYALECVDRLIKDIMKNDLPFGGKTVLLSGDFRQTLPVVQRGSRSEIVNQTIKRSKIWDKVNSLKLTKNLRIKSQDADSLSFCQYLLNLGEGKIQYSNKEEDEIRLPEKNISKSQTVKEFVLEMFQDNQFGENNLNFDDRIILTPTNDDADEINEIVLDIFKKDEPLITYYSFDKPGDNENLKVPTEFLNSLKLSGLPPHELKLKKDLRIIILRNLYPKKGFCNGTRCKIVKLERNFIEVEIIFGEHKGNRTLLPRISLKSSSKTNPIQFTRTQFPIKQANALTINKSQGQTFNRVGLYLKSEIFSHGQLYVALSRGNNLDQIKVFLNSDQNKCKNIVYKEILD